MVPDGGGGRHKTCHLEPRRSSAAAPTHATSLNGPMEASNPHRRRRIKDSRLFALSLLFFAAAVLLLSNEYLLEGAYEQLGDLTDEDLTRAALMRDDVARADRDQMNNNNMRAGVPPGGFSERQEEPLAHLAGGGSGVDALSGSNPASVTVKHNMLNRTQEGGNNNTAIVGK